MNFWKNFKRPSTLPPHFRKIVVHFFPEKVWKRPFIEVQHLQYRFMDWKWKFIRFGSVTRPSIKYNQLIYMSVFKMFRTYECAPLKKEKLILGTINWWKNISKKFPFSTLSHFFSIHFNCLIIQVRIFSTHCTMTFLLKEIIKLKVSHSLGFFVLDKNIQNALSFAFLGASWL